MRISDWSSDVCSSDLLGGGQPVAAQQQRRRRRGRAHDRQRSGDARVRQSQREIQRDVGNLPLGRAIVAAVDSDGEDGRGGSIGHGSSLEPVEPGWKHCDGAAIQSIERTINARSEEHTSELQSLMRISYAVFCLKKKNNRTI